MMTLENRLQIAIGLMAFTGALLLGIAQSNYLLPALMGFAVILSHVFTDRLGWLRLHRSLANLAMVMTAGLSLIDFFESDSVAQLAAIARLLVYVQMVMLFQEKNYRIYGHLATFSLLQVVVASLLNVGLVFGLILVVYLFFSLLSLVLFCLHRDRVQVGQRNVLRRRISDHYATVEREGQETAGDPLWRAALGGRSQLSAELPNDSTEYRAFRSWLPQVFGLGVGTLAFALCFFYAMPRIREGGWRKMNMGQQQTGFSGEVSFSHMSEILQSDELVMQVSFTKPLSETPLEIIGEPYFRGTTLTYYSSENGGGWSKTATDPFGLSDLSRRPPDVPLVIQRTALSFVNDQKTLFATMPAFRFRETPRDARYHLNHISMVKESRRKSGALTQYEYSVLTTAFDNGRQVGMLPYVIPTQYQFKLPAVRRQWYQIPEEIAPVIRSIADRVVRQTEEDRVSQAIVMEHFLRDSTDFRYTLSLNQVETNPNLDPVVDFLTNHRSGHCEYFASALVLMLRSKGIPARVVVGYKGGDYNEIGSYYKVRQKHAHTWAEVFVEREDMSAEQNEFYRDKLVGGWLRLDPTPVDRGGLSIETAIAENPVVNQVSDTFDYAESMWEEYVVGLTPERQQQIYSPMGPTSTVEDWFSEANKTSAATVDLSAGKKIERYLTLTLRVVLTLGLAGGVLWLLSRLRSKRRRRQAGSVSQAARPTRVEFYQRLVELLQSHGLKRDPTQTPMEWANRLCTEVDALGPGKNGHFENVHGGDDAADYAYAHASESSNGEKPSNGSGLSVSELTWVFYRVRFGRRDLDNAEAESIEHALQNIEAALAGNGK